MKKQFLDYHHSKMMKELMFDEECIGFYNPSYTEMNGSVLFSGTAAEFDNWNKNEYFISAPLWKQVKQWLWEKHKITFEVRNYSDGFLCVMVDGTIRNTTFQFDSPITAEQEGIKKAIEYLHSRIKK